MNLKICQTGTDAKSVYSAFPINFLKSFLGWNGGYFSTRERSNDFGGVTGIYLQITARVAPVRAIHTTLTAEGTRAA